MTDVAFPKFIAERTKPPFHTFLPGLTGLFHRFLPPEMIPASLVD
jgi:hypothetical protein